MIQRSQRKCNNCNGKGKIYSSCENCNFGIYKEQYIFQFKLNENMGNNQNIVFTGEGNENHDQDRGDFVVQIIYKQHNFYDLDEKNNLNCILNISLREALCGFEKQIVHPNNETILIKGNDITPNTITIIKSKGLTKKSDMKIKYDISFPSLDQSQKVMLSRILSK